MDNQYIVKAINKIRPSAEFSFTDDDYSTIQWIVLDGDAPTKAELEKAIKEVKADEVAKAKQAEIDRNETLAKLGITADELKAILA
jgi:hypothetical protein